MKSILFCIWFISMIVILLLPVYLWKNNKPISWRDILMFFIGVWAISGFELIMKI